MNKQDRLTAAYKKHKKTKSIAYDIYEKDKNKILQKYNKNVFLADKEYVKICTKCKKYLFN